MIKAITNKIENIIKSRLRHKINVQGAYISDSIYKDTYCYIYRSGNKNKVISIKHWLIFMLKR